MKQTKLFFIFVLAFLLVGAMSFSALADGAVEISPNTPTTNDQLYCQVLAGGTGYTYYWYANSQAMGISGAYVSPTYTTTGDSWKCIVKKYYGSQVGWITIGQDIVTILSGNPPVVNITQPSNNSVFNYSQTVTLMGTATDPETGALSGASLVWTSTINGQIGTGNLITISNLAAGNHTIILTATDPEGLSATASINIVVLGVDQPPNFVQIVNPDNGSVFLNGSSINFEGYGSDANDGALSGNNLVWTSDISGNFGNGTNFSAVLPAGTHTITLTAVDSLGQTTLTSVVITVLGPNALPVANITAPIDGSNFSSGQQITFTGTGMDAEDGVLNGNSLVWTSDISGNFGNGTSYSAVLPAGTHTITLTAIDSVGQNSTDTITITVLGNQNPTVYIILPTAGANFTAGQAIQFSGNATDPESGVLTGTNLVWTSNETAGVLGYGTTFATNLSVGTHLITLTANDGTGGSANASVIINVLPFVPNSNPLLTVISPIDGQNFTCNSAVLFDAVTSDPDGNNVTVSWSSNIDGALGTGNTFSLSNLTCGATHAINVLASDGIGGINQTTVTINILPFFNPAPTVIINNPANNTQFARVCGNVAFDATATAYGGASIASYTWFYNSNIIGTNSSFSVPSSIFALGNQTITVLVEDTYNATNTSSVTIELMPHTAPTVQILNPLNNTAFWDWEFILFNAIATPTDSCPTNFTWIWRDNNNAVINTSQSFSAQLPVGNHTITAYAVDSYNATGFDQISIAVNLTPNALPLVSITSPLNGTSFVRACQTITFTSNAIDPDGNITEYVWYWGSTNISNTANFTMPASFFGAGNQTIMLTVRDNRNGVTTATANFMVVPHVAPTVTITSPLNNSNYTLIATVPFSATAAVNDICPTNFTYTWMDNSAIVNYSQAFNLSNMLPGIHTIMVLATDSYTLQDSDVIYLNITIIPNIPPVIVSPITCVNQFGGNVLNEYEPIFCSANATDFDGNITQWTWNVQNSYGPFFTPYNFSVPYPYLGNGTYNVTLYVVDDDFNQTATSALIQVQNNAPLVTITSNVSGGVEPQRIMFTCSVTQGNRPYTYTFNFGNGVTDFYTGNETSANFSINYPQNGTFNPVCSITDFDGDYGNATTPITITDTVPVGNFNFTPAAPLECTNVQFTSNVSAYDGILSYFWDFADGKNSTAQNPLHNFTANANYNVALTVTDMDNSFSTFTNTVPVQDTNPLVDAGPDRDVIEGNNITLIGSAIKQCDNITTYSWFFPDNGATQTGQVVSHNFTANGTYLVILTVSDSDSSVSDNLTVVVNDTVPTANAFANPNPVVEGNQVVLNASLSTGYDQPLSYQWIINGTVYNTGANPLLPQIFGPYNSTLPVMLNALLTVTDSDGSQSNASLTIVVIDSVPVANATVATPNPIYEGQNVVFDASLSILNIDSPFNYTWYFGDGNVTTTQNQVISHIYAQNGTYTARLVVTDLDGSWDDDFVTVNVLDTTPAVNFNWNPASPFEGFQVNFTDLTTAYDNLSLWMWDFGDSNTSAVQNATHTYKYNGTYNVTLYVRDADDSLWQNFSTQIIVVQNLVPQISFTANPSTGSELLNVSFNCSASGNAPFSYSLNFGDSTSMNVVSSLPVLTSKTYLNGTYTAVCSVVDDDGDAVNLTASLLVTDLSPNATFTGNTSLLQGQTGFYNASNSTSFPDAITAYEWDWDYTGTFSTDATTLGPIANHTFYVPGIITVAMRVVDTDSVSAPAFLDVNVTNVVPTVAFVPATYAANESDNITFTVSYFDPGFDAVSFEWDWDYNGTFAAQNATLVNTTVHSWADDVNIPFLVAVVGIDQWGGRSNVSTAVVTISNVPPVPTLNLPLYICSNESSAANPNITLLATVSDPGADQWTYFWNVSYGSTIEQFFDINISRQANLTYNCAGKPIGLYNVTLLVSDGDGGIGNASTIISITNGTGNNPPVILSPANNQTVWATVGIANLIPISVFDADQDSVTLDNNASITIQNVTQAGYFTSAQFSFVPLVEGLTQVNITACDNSTMPNNCTSNLFTINATNVNTPPVAVFIGVAGQEGLPVLLNGTASFDADNDTIVEYRWVFGGNTSLGFTYNTTTPTVSPAYFDNGTYSATLTVVDSRGFVSLADPAAVSIADVPPAISGLQAVTFNEDTSITITLTADDVPLDPVITFSASGSDVNFSAVPVQINSNTFNLTFTPVPNWNGFKIVTFTVVNKDATSSYPINVTVASINDIPEVNAIPSQNLTEDSLFAYQVVATDNDTADVLSYAVSGPAGMTINSTGAINWVPNNTAVGTYNVTVQVTDSASATTSVSFLITVQNNPTQILAFNPPLNATVGLLYQYDVNSADEGAGDIFSLPVAPVGMTITQSGVISWTPLPSQTGFFPVTVQANDTNGGIDSRSYVIFVVPAGTFGVSITATPTSQPVIVNGTAFYTITVTNTGTVSDSYNLTFNNVNGANVVTLLPNATAIIASTNSQSAVLTVNGSQNITYSVIVTATSNANSAINASVTVLANVTLASADTVPPVVSGISAGSLTNVSAIISWTTNESANSAVNYGLTTSLGTSASNGAYVLAHSVPLSGLLPSTTYYYNVTSCDLAGNCATSGPLSFTTLANGVIIPANGTVINSTIAGIFYLQNTTAQVNAILGYAGLSGQTSVINSTIAGTTISIIDGFINRSNITSSFINNANVSFSRLTNSNTSNATLRNVTYINVTFKGGSDANSYPFAGTVSIFDPTLENNTFGGTNYIYNPTTIYNTRFYNVFINASYIDFSNLSNVTITQSIVLSCIVNNSRVIDGSVLSDCTVLGSSIINSTVDNSKIVNSTINSSTVTNSNVTSSTVINSTIDNSNINKSNITNSFINGSTIINSNITNSTIINTNITNGTVINANITNGTIYNGTVCINGNCYNGTGPLNLSQFPSATLSANPASGTGSFDSDVTATAVNFNTSINKTYSFDFNNDGAYDSTVTTNASSATVTNNYASSMTTRVRITDNAGSTAYATVAITSSAPSSSSGGGGGGGGSGSGIGGGSGQLAHTTTIDLEHNTPQTVYADYYDTIKFDYNGVTYSIVFTNVSPQRSADMTIYPPKIPVSLLVKGSTLVNIDDEPTDDLSIILNAVDRIVINDSSSNIGRVRYKVNLTLNLIKLEKKKIAPVIDKNPKNQTKVEQVVDDIKSGVLDVIATVTPNKKPSPIVGTTITAGIILVGLAGYFIFRKKEPKFEV